MGPRSVRLWNELRALFPPVFCRDARHAAAGPTVMLAKTNRNDAAGPAPLVRTGWFSQMHVRTACGRVVRAEPATRTLLVRMRRDIENQIRGVLTPFGLVIGKAPRRPVKRADEIVAEKLVARPELASQVESPLAVRAGVADRFAAIDRRLILRGRITVVCRRCITVPGFGPIAALAVRSSIDGQARLTRSRDVGASFGLTPRRYASGEMTRSGNIAQCGDRTVRSLPYEAASVRLVKTSRTSARRGQSLPIALRSRFKKANLRRPFRQLPRLSLPLLPTVAVSSR